MDIRKIVNESLATSVRAAEEIQISGLNPKPTPVAGTDKFGIDDDSNVSWRITAAEILTYVNTNMTLQQVYDNTSAPQKISFAVDAGIVFTNSTDDNVFIIHQDFSTSFRPFSVSQDGTSGVEILPTSDPWAVSKAQSTTQGAFTTPRMTTARMNALPAMWSLGIDQQGLEVYVTDGVNGKYYWDGTTFVYLTNSGTSGDSLQAAYLGGNTISLVGGRPVIVSTQTAPENFIWLYSPGAPTPYNYDSLEGMRFTPAVSGYVTALQYVDVYFPSGSRQVAIFRESDQALIVSDLVYKTDPLDSTSHYRTHQIVAVPLEAGVSYVVVCIVPANENWTFYAITSPADFSYTGITFAQAASSPVFPNTISNTLNAVYGNQNFQFTKSTSELNINDGTSASFFTITSTTQASIPAPSMSTSDFAAIPGLSEAMCAWDNILHCPTVYDGTSVKNVLLGGSGKWTPTFTTLVGCTGITLINAWYTIIGNILTGVEDISLTATDSDISFISDLPIVANFTSAIQASIMGQILTTASPDAGDGDVLNVTSIASSSTVKIAVNATVGTGIKYLRVSFICEIQ